MFIYFKMLLKAFFFILLSLADVSNYYLIVDDLVYNTAYVYLLVVLSVLDVLVQFWSDAFNLAKVQT